MKTLIAALMLMAPAVVPASALAQVAAGSVPNSFERPAGQAAAPARPAQQRPASAPLPPIGGQTDTPTQAPAEAPDIARSEEALRAVIAAAQGPGFDYAAFTENLAEQIRAREAQFLPLLKSFGAVQSVEFQRPEGTAHMFRVVFDNQETDWLIGFSEDDRISALLFRPAED